MQAVMHLTHWYIVCVYHQSEACENSIGSVYIGGYSGLTKNRMRI